MPSNRSSKAKRASATDPAEVRAREAELRGRQDPKAPESPAASMDTTDEATGLSPRSAQPSRWRGKTSAHSPGAVGPIGRTLLLITLFALVGLIAIWVLLAL